MCNRRAMFIRTSFGLSQIRSNTPYSIKLNNDNQRTPLAPFFKPLFVDHKNQRPFVGASLNRLMGGGREITLGLLHTQNTGQTEHISI